MNFSFIHAADIHLGRSFSGLSAFSYDENTEKKYEKAIKTILNNIVNIAIEKNVDFIFIAGDTFDSDEQDFSSKLILKEVLKRLDSLNIKVFLICGNHDPLYSYNKNTFNFGFDSNIKIIGLNTENNCEIPLYNRENELVGILHALSFSEEKFTQNPAEFFKRPDDTNKNLFHIGLLHCDLDGDKSSPYAPCSKNNLIQLNYNYWALGHIHIPTNNNDIVQYAGTVQGRNPKETEEHGIKYIKVQNNNITYNSFISTDIIRYCDIDIDISSAIDSTEALDIIEEELKNNLTGNNNCEEYLIKLHLTGNIPFFNEIKGEFFQTLSEQIKTVFANRIYISTIINDTNPIIDETALSTDDGITGELYKILTNNEVFEKECSAIFENYNNLLYMCNFDKEEYKSYKRDIENEVKKEGINICSSLYGKDEDV